LATPVWSHRLGHLIDRKIPRILPLVPEISSTKLSLNPHLLPAGPHARVLDVGCGDGRHIAIAAERRTYAVGVDYDPAELRKSKARLGRARLAATGARVDRPAPVDLIAADASHLPFRPDAFDAVICTETLEHLPDDTAAMREIARVLTPGGLLHGAVPSHFTEIPYFALSPGYRNAPGGHVRIYAPKRLFAKLHRAGFRIDQMRYVHFVDSLVWLRFCLTDFLRPSPKRRSAFEAAVMIAVAAERPVPTWRTRLRHALARSKFIAACESVGALIWPKSLTFVAIKAATSRTHDRPATLHESAVAPVPSEAV
jgi:SAM-dependent methyltransferase